MTTSVSQESNSLTPLLLCSNCTDMSSAGTGAPSVSASDSTFTKCFGEGQYCSRKTTTLQGRQNQDAVLIGDIAEGASSNPFGSKCSTASGGLKRTGTSTPQSLVSTAAPEFPLNPTHEVLDLAEDAFTCAIAPVTTPGRFTSTAAGKVPAVCVTATTDGEDGGSATPSSLRSSRIHEGPSGNAEIVLIHGVGSSVPVAEESVDLFSMHSGRKKIEASALDLELKELDALKLDFSDNDGGPLKAPAYPAEFGRPLVCDYLPHAL